MYSYIELMKPRLSATVIFSCLAGYLLAADDVEILLLSKLLIGGIFLVGSANGLNQIYEVNIDKLMEEFPFQRVRFSKYCRGYNSLFN